MTSSKYLSQIFYIGVLMISASCAMQKMGGRTVTDIDGNRYTVVTIGEQKWLGEDLKTTRYNDGTPVPNVTDITEWRHYESPAYAWYNNDITNKDTFGAMYNWWAAGSRPGLCPKGWRVASDDDWKKLEEFLGMTPEQIEGTAMRGTDEGGKLKETGTRTWTSSGEEVTDEYGFSVVPGGRRADNGIFSNMTRTATYWTSTETSASCAIYRHFGAGNNQIGRNISAEKKYGLAVRCIKNR
jgi:uncharacterized protein (TIGR02145 family)